jgi:molybdopterin molybdotransferase
MILANEAETIILNLVRPFNPRQDTEVVKLENATGRILAKAIASKIDFPYWDNSAMDGYAVRYQDVSDCTPDNPITLEIVEEIPAGYPPQKTIESGQTARIFTGAMLPPGADTIVIQENTQKESNTVKILAAPEAKQFVRYKGAYCQAGQTMLRSGIVLEASDLAVLATAQCSEIPVYRRPKIAILSTGDELVTPGTPLKPGQIIDSNQYALASFVIRHGGIPVTYGIIPDNPEMLKNAIQRAIEEADIVLSTGGVSVGDYDYVDSILTELGSKIQISSVAIKPGKPLTVASFNNNCLYFGIPGNPVSALVSCWRFVLPAIKKLSGMTAKFTPTFIKATTQNQLKGGGNREIYLWGKLNVIEGEFQFSLASGSHQSANLINLAQTNGLAVIPIGQSIIEAGETVMVMPI